MGNLEALYDTISRLREETGPFYFNVQNYNYTYSPSLEATQAGVVISDERASPNHL